MGELLDGFNGMARKLASDKLELERYISEIVGLKERGGRHHRVDPGRVGRDRRGGADRERERLVPRPLRRARGIEGERIVDIERGPFDAGIVEAARGALHDKENRGGITRRAADGRTFEIKLYPLVAATRPEGARCILIVEDASERLAYEERVIQADKLASIGMLSAGVAHEINNPALLNPGQPRQRHQRGTRSRGRRLPQGRRERDAQDRQDREAAFGLFRPQARPRMVGRRAAAMRRE